MGRKLLAQGAHLPSEGCSAQTRALRVNTAPRKPTRRLSTAALFVPGAHAAFTFIYFGEKTTYSA